MDDALAGRAAFRTHTRAVLRAPHGAPQHLARLQSALQLPGAEPVQGALADLFVAAPAGDPALRRNALQLVQSRLNPYVADSFSRHAGGAARLPAINPMATRWSVLAQPSAGVPARVRRAGSDDSRRLAANVVDALHGGEVMEASRIEAAFLGHCVSCQDKLAFMLAMRDLRRAGISVDARWTRVAEWLQQRDVFGAQHGDEAVAGLVL